MNQQPTVKNLKKRKASLLDDINKKMALYNELAALEDDSESKEIQLVFKKMKLNSEEQDKENEFVTITVTQPPNAFDVMKASSKKKAIQEKAKKEFEMLKQEEEEAKIASRKETDRENEIDFEEEISEDKSKKVLFFLI